ncbi:aminoacyl-tRNA hydrolase [Bryobacter aggregatus]|uniref:aminoacyl-tRNA hydrolase n=1 Tax=Bryobacter aggregatus TaxID=360054 RepID=UPI0004E1308A|nr:aminoacyl-tRNA hydrolase [Bryobacter aggregatus]
MRSWLIVGLGNPGPEYDWTPHNVGFLAVDRFAQRNGLRVSRPECQSLVGVGDVKGDRVIVAKPLTFMNVSGAAVRQLLDKYELEAANLIVVYDELALEWGNLRLRPRGSAGGHNGMKSIISAVRTEEFTRVRLGINPGSPLGGGPIVLGEKAKHYVLAGIPKSMRAAVDLWLDDASSAIETIIAEGVEKAMTSFNRRAPGLKEEEK